MQVNMSSELILKEVPGRIFGSYRTFALKRKTKQLFLAVCGESGTVALISSPRRSRRTQRGQSRNQRFGISPAKTQRPQRKLLSELGALRALAGGISESEMFCVWS